MEPTFYKTYFEVEKNHWWFKTRRNILFWLIEKFRNKKNNKFSIFDFGCGSGFLVGELQSLGYDAFGADTSKEAIEFGLRKGIRNIKVVEADEMPSSESLDMILALDVIEHVKDDVNLVVSLERSLKPGGVLMVTVPAYEWMWGVQDEVALHFRRYNMSSLLSLVRNRNFSILKKSYFNTFLFIPIAFVRLVDKLFKIKSRESDFDINNKLVNALFYFVFNLESKLFKLINFPFGVSILLVLRKNA